VAVYLVRHGEANVNKNYEEIYPGPKLTGKGRKQAEGIAKGLVKVKFRKFYCSDMTRAVQTADIINKKLKIKVSYAKEIRELNKIIFEESPKDKAKYNKNISRARAIRKFIGRLRKEKGNILVVCHANVIVAAIHDFLGIPATRMKRFQIDKCSVVIVNNRIRIFNNKPFYVHG